MPITVAPVEDALLHHGAKTPVGSVLRTAALAQLPLELRVRGQFSAGVESARVLQRIQDGVQDILAHNRDEGGALVNRSGFIADLQKLAISEGLTPQDPKKQGGLEDITSERRTELIYSMQTGQAYGYANYAKGQNEDALDAVPAQRLTRIRQARKPRDWSARWAAAGSKVGWVGAAKSDHVALKTSPIWEALSRFGTPYPPFDFGSGMWVSDVLRPEAIKLGLIHEQEVVKPSITGFNETLEASTTGLSKENRQNLESIFGDQVAVDEEKVRWKGDPQAYETDRRNRSQDAGRIFARSAGHFEASGLGDVPAGGGGSYQERVAELAREAIPQWSTEISAVGTGRKPLFHESIGYLEIQDPDGLAAALQKDLPQGVVARHEDGHLFVYHQGLISRLADPAQDVWPQVKANSDNGRWLGYGISFLAEPKQPIAHVVIVDAGGKVVSGFFAPTSEAELYASARALDWVMATGQPHIGVIIKVITRGGA